MMRPLIFLSLLSACAPDTPPFKLAFTAVAGGNAIGCTDTITGLGPNGAYTVGINDLRFYVSNVRFYDKNGGEIGAIFDANEFQHAVGTNVVSLIDLTGNSEGTCAETSFGEGTERTHAAITGTTIVSEITRVTFDVGIPAKVVKDVIGNNTLEGAPSPFAEMYWSWASGYRYFVLNFATHDAAGTRGEGFVHVGSRGCGPMGGKALEDREACDFVNIPTVALAGFDLKTNTVAVDLNAVLANLDFRAPVRDPMTFAVVGETVGVECHSSPSQPHCPSIFSSFGISTDGSADAAKNAVFKVR